MAKSDVLSFRTDSQKSEALQQVAVLNGITLSDLLDQVVDDYVLDLKSDEFEGRLQRNLDQLTAKIQGAREDERLRTGYKNRTRDIRAIRTAFYTLHYTGSVDRATESLDEALNVFEGLTDEQKQNIADFRGALTELNKPEIMRFLRLTSGLNRINQGDLCLRINQLCNGDEG